jgi:hypothetical protein
MTKFLCDAYEWVVTVYLKIDISSYKAAHKVW